MNKNRKHVLAGSLAIVMLSATVPLQAAEDEVWALQNALYGAGYNIGTADGEMGPSTRSALEAFQKDHPDLEATGEVMDATRAALGLVASTSEPTSGNSAGQSDQQAATQSSDAPAKTEPKQESDGEIEEEEDGSWSFF